jgi:hypothetical protein
MVGEKKSMDKLRLQNLQEGEDLGFFFHPNDEMSKWNPLKFHC